jgi:uncharacterized protein (DUF433 family)
MELRSKRPVVNWFGCEIVETNPRRLSGVPILKGTRVQADSILENYEWGSPGEEIAENFGIPEAVIRELLAFAAHQQSQPQP